MSAMTQSTGRANTDLLNEPLIERALRELIARDTCFTVLCLDLINFRLFLNEYGWQKGDAVLQMLAQVVQDCVAQYGNPSDVVTHVGWDIFAVITVFDHAELLAKEIIARFDSLIPEFYDEVARRRGYIDLVDRRGNPHRTPILGIAIAIVGNEKRDLTHPLQVSQLAAEVRRSLHLATNSCYAFDRRVK